MLEAFFLRDHETQIEDQWRQKTLVSCEILGCAAHRYLRPEILGDRTRLDVMWNGKTLGIRGPSRPDGSFAFFALSKPDTATPAISQMMEEFLSTPVPLKFAQIRFRISAQGERGLWIDTSNEQIRELLHEPTWLQQLVQEKKWVVEAGQKRKEVVIDASGKVSVKPAKGRVWLNSYDVNNREIPLLSLAALFSQPGPEANRALLAAGFDLLDEAQVPHELRWIEWGAGYGNLSAAYASRLGPKGVASELESGAAEWLEHNAAEFFPGVETACRSVEKGVASNMLDADLWLIDPPRPGFPQLLSKLSEKDFVKPRWVLAYHCHASGLLSDSRALKNAGYKIHHWSSVDVFPATPHHEVVSLWQI